MSVKHYESYMLTLSLKLPCKGSFVSLKLTEGQLLPILTPALLKGGGWHTSLQRGSQRGPVSELHSTNLEVLHRTERLSLCNPEGHRMFSLEVMSCNFTRMLVNVARRLIPRVVDHHGS